MRVLYSLSLAFVGGAYGWHPAAGVAVTLAIIGGMAAEGYLTVQRKYHRAESNVVGQLWAVQHMIRFAPNSDVRLTVYVRYGEDELYQAVPYVPSGKFSSQNPIRISKGVVGRCWRTNAICYDRLLPEGDARAYLAEQYGFSHEDIDYLQLDRRAWLALPVSRKDESIKAVLYLDSRLPDTFTSDIVSQLTRLCVSLARVV